jgi:hypothetical protein
MNNIDKKFSSILVSFVLLGGCDPELALEGVAAEAAVHHEIEDLARAGEASVRVDDLDVGPIAEAVSVRVGQLSDGSFGVLEGAEGRAIAPGVWEVEAEDGLVQQVVVGDEGHGWLIGQMTAQLDELRDRLDTEAGHEDTLLEQILAGDGPTAIPVTSIVGGPRRPRTAGPRSRRSTGPRLRRTGPPTALPSAMGGPSVGARPGPA